MSSLVALDLKQRHIIHHRWSLVEGMDLPLGRSVERHQLRAAWDASIADWHATLCWQAGKLQVKRRTDVPATIIFYNGEERDEFELIPGEGFVIGSTVFQLDPSNATPNSPVPASSRTQIIPLDQLRSLVSGSEHLEAVSTLLKQLQARRLDIQAFEEQVVQTLCRMVRRADFAAIVRVQAGEATLEAAKGDLPLCKPLVLDACRRQQLIAQRWIAKGQEPYPASPGVEWAVCTPVICDLEAQGDYAVYLAGSKAPTGNPRGSRPLPDDQLALVSIIGEILQSVRTLHELNQCRDSMQEFFPKPIRDPLLQRGPAEVFRTEQSQAAILFCDLRGSSRFAEQAADLLPAWQRIKEALSVMTEAITNHSGCIGDFQGDAAMGFWGWPRRGHAARLPDDVRAACQAADTLRERFLQKSQGEGPLAGFGCGIGIAAGSVIAGMLGTVDQRKIGVFGPAVNLAARLESMTKQIGAAILVDQQAADALQLSQSELADRLREIALIQPAGMDGAFRVFELMPPAATGLALQPKQLRLFRAAREDFQAGRWTEARHSFGQLAASGDGPSQFLLKYIESVVSPPADWVGRVTLTAK